VAVRALTALALAAGLALPAQAEPRRIVSVNPCLDAILVAVADRGQVAAVDHYSHEPENSSLDADGRRLPFTYGTAEEIVALRPDLVLAPRIYPPSTLRAIAALGIRVELFDLPESVQASLAQVDRIAAITGHPDRGRRLRAEIEAALAAAAPRPGQPRLGALTFHGGGVASAQGTLMDELLRRAGFVNQATRYGLRQTGYVPLERLVADPPEVLLAAPPEPGRPDWADRVVNHPALRSIGSRMIREPFPTRLTHCGGPVIIEAAAALAQARDDALERRR